MMKVLKKLLIGIMIFSIMIAPSFSSLANDIYENKDVDKNIEDVNNIAWSEPYAVETEGILQDAKLKEIINDSNQGVNELQEAIIKVSSYEKNNEKKQEIGNIDLFKESVKLKYPEMSDLDLGKSVLRALGDSEEFISSLSEEKIIEALDYTYVIKTQSFIKQTVDGEQIYMSEADFYNELDRFNENRNDFTKVSKSSNNLIYDYTEEKENYIILITNAYKTNPSYALDGRNYFTIRGEIQWESEPIYRFEDIFTIASSGNIDDQYDAYACAQWRSITDSSSNISHEVHYGDMSLSNILTVENSSMHDISARINLGWSEDSYFLKSLCMYYGIFTQSDVSCQIGYAHKTMELGDISVGTDVEGNISFSISVGSTMNQYKGRAFTIPYENYAVRLDSPTNNVEFSSNQSPPSFSWTMIRGNPKNSFLQIDYLNNASYLSIPISNYETHCDLSTSLWNTIKNQSPFTGNLKVIRWRVKIKYTAYGGVESYYSGWRTFKISGIQNPLLLNIDSSTRYTERILDIQPEGYKELSVTFGNSAYQMIQTFGHLDTIIQLYSSTGTLLASNDDAGYNNNALLSYYFEANTEYKIRVSFCYSSEAGLTKIAIIPTYYCDSYEDIQAYVDYSMEIRDHFQTNRVEIITCEYSHEQEMTLTLYANEDTCLYIIDPTSTDAIVETAGGNMGDDKYLDNLFNDDFDGAMDSRITKNFEYDIPYLVIFSAYDPAAVDSSVWFDVYFE